MWRKGVWNLAHTSDSCTGLRNVAGNKRPDFRKYDGPFWCASGGDEELKGGWEKASVCLRPPLCRWVDWFSTMWASAVVWMKTGAFRYRDGPKLGGQLVH